MEKNYKEEYDELVKKNEYKKKELLKLKAGIEKEEEKLFFRISEALSNNDESTYNTLKQRQLQCTAELRLIQHIENNFTGDFMVC